MLNSKFVLRVLALLVMSLWAQNAAALTCPAATGAPGAGNTAAELFANATEDTCGSANFSAGPTKNGHIFYADEYGVGVQFIYNGVPFAPTSKSLSCTGSLGGSSNATTIQELYFATVSYSTLCTLTYMDINNQTVTHVFSAGSMSVGGGGARVGFLNPSSITSGWFERVSPTVTLSGVTGVLPDGAIVVTATFNEPITSIDPADFSLTNATVASITVLSTSTFEFNLVPIATGAFSAQLPANAITDLSGNGNTASNTISGTADFTAPTVELTGLAATIGNTPQWVTITFSEPVYGFVPTNLNVVNALITGYTIVSTREYQVELTRSGTGAVSIDVPAGAAVDIAGNFNLTSAILSATVDLTGPTVVLSGLGAAVGLVPQTVTATFNEDVTGFTLSDILAPDMTLSNFTAVSASVYTFDLSNGRSVAVSVQIPAGTVLDLAGNANLASNTLTANADPTPPSIWITGLPGTISGPVTFDATINFSESVTGFVQADINISGGSITAFSGSGTTYTATVLANGVDDLVMSVSANAAQDAALNYNDASPVFTVSSVVAEFTGETIAQFMQTRANALLSNQPDLAGLLRGGAGGKFAAEVTREGGVVAFDSGYDAPIWARLNVNWSTDLGAESQYIYGVVGGYTKLSKNLLIGGMVQFDVMSESNGTATTQGTGWLLGPYFVAKLPSQPLYFEGSLLYGQTANTISLLGGYTDAFSTERWLATLGISGQMQRANLTLIPFLDAKYTSDAQAAYIDGLGNPIAAQTIGLAQATAGLDFELAVNGATTLNGGISGVWSYSSGSTVTPGYEGGRARVDLGVEHRLSDCNALGLSGFYDGLGTQGFESFGAAFKWKSCF